MYIYIYICIYNNIPKHSMQAGDRTLCMCSLCANRNANVVQIIICYNIYMKKTPVAAIKQTRFDKYDRSSFAAVFTRQKAPAAAVKKHT